MILTDLAVLLRQPFYVVGVAHLLLLGVMHCFPVWTSSLITFGFSPEEVLLMGVALQAGMGVPHYPLHRLGSVLGKRYPLPTVDRLLSTLTGGVYIFTLIGLAAILKWGSPQHFPYMALLCHLHGCATGGLFVLTINVMNHNLYQSQSMRRTAVALASVSFGVGGVFHILAMSKLLVSGISLSTALLGFALLQVTISSVRLIMFTRGKANIVGAQGTAGVQLSEILPESALPQSNISQAASSEPEPNGQPEGLETLARNHTDNGEGTDELALEDARPLSTNNEVVHDSNTESESTNYEEEEPKPTELKDYYSNRVVWLACITTGIGLGVSSTFISSIGNLANEIATTEVSRVELTVQVSTANLVAQVCGRIASALIYARANNPWVLGLWQLIIVTGLFSFTFVMTPTTVTLASACFGIGFGGLSTSFPVVASVNFPGGSNDYIKGLSLGYITFTVLAIVFGQLQNALLLAGPWAVVNPSEYFSVYLMYLMFGILATGLSIALALQLREIPLLINSTTSSSSTIARRPIRLNVLRAGLRI